VTQQDESGRILKKWYASSAVYDPVKKVWKFEKGKIVEFAPDGDVATEDLYLTQVRVITDFTETPWRVASSELNPNGLSVPELQEYMVVNSDFPAVQLAPYKANLADRYALPFQCLLAVFIGAPLGIVYNRRGVIGGVTGAIALLVVMLLSHHFFLTMGKGLRINPFVAPWISTAALGLVGMILMWYRSTNRDFPKFTFSLRR
jgi:lipopolysaccharide export LptBFGC system permease protein LptF